MSNKASEAGSSGINAEYGESMFLRPLRVILTVGQRRSYTGPPPQYIVLFGAPGAGKGTQTKKIERDYGIQTFSTGDYLRQAVRDGTPLGVQIKELMNRGGMINDDIMSQVVEDMLINTEKGFLLDGYPRNINQAEKLDQLMARKSRFITLAIFLDVEKSVLLERITNRRVHPASGRVYHLSYNPPKVDGVDDVTGEPLIQRDDDKEETMNQRLTSYETMTKPLIEHYKAAGVLHIIPSPTSDVGYVHIKKLLDKVFQKE
eukprot:TRINITY_DN1323_c0_g3_i1.p1 TRINITY_DN1323_c0_g3~~TRINITY_DN1323_c0_g3_i1.p1  ORF type:complete len:260 (-),score=56.16 TRINITY_DN1323_c0_g3_i1:50-829(-)